MVLQVWGLQNQFTKKTCHPRPLKRLTYLESEMAKGVHTNFQLSRFFLPSLERIARSVTSAPGSTPIQTKFN